MSETQTQATGKRQRFREVAYTQVTFTEQVNDTDSPGRIRAIGAVADQLNHNRRVYPAAVLREAVERAQARLNRSLSQGRYLLGEADHPPNMQARLFQTIVVWDEILFNETTKFVELSGRILKTTAGQEARLLMSEGIMPGVSLRGYGQSETVQDEDGNPYEEVTYLELTGFDLVFEQSFDDARVTVMEQTAKEQEEPNMSEKEVKQEQAEQPTPTPAPTADNSRLADKLAEQMEALSKAQAELAEARRAAADAEAAKAQLAEAKAALENTQRIAARDAAIAETTADLPYPGPVAEAFVEAVKGADLADAEAVKVYVEKRRREFDAIVAAAKVAEQGGPAVKVVGPVFETETGKPDFVQFSHKLTEQMDRMGYTQKHSPDSRGAKLAEQYLAAFDNAYRSQLIAEDRAYRVMQEAQTVSDLSLPYLVTRTVIEEAVPLLVAANVFDIGLVDGNPARVWFESYAHESGVLTQVTDETVTAADDTWQDLANKSIVPGTVLVEAGGTSTAYDENVDYLIDYAEGRIKTIGAGAIADEADLDVTYQYEAVRTGENTAIQRGKATLTAQDITLTADRLAGFITDEALTFSGSNLSYDAAARTAMMIVRELNERIDRRILMAARTAAYESGNSGGSWTASGADYDELVLKLGLASAAVKNDHYTPTAIVGSVTNVERLRNWSGFNRDGKPDAALGAGGTELRVKGLPVYESTQMTDDAFLVVNRELVMHRVYSGSPMSLKGPFPVRNGDGLLVAGQEWYAQEYNYSFVPIKEKAGYVIVA